jgi:two-component sensor histidine kinase
MGASQDLDFEQLFGALPSPYMVLDADMNFVAVNTEYERVTMRPASDYIGRYIFDKFPNEGPSGQRLRESFARVMESGEPDTIPFLPYDIPKPDSEGGGLERRFWTCIHTPLLDAEGKTRFIVQNTVDVTEIARLREVAHLPYRAEETQLLERAREAEAQHRTLMAESEDFRRLFQQSPGFFAVLWGPDHTFTFANDAYNRLVGGRQVVGRAIRDALPEVVEQGFVEMLDEVYRTGEPTGGQATRIMLANAAGQPLRETFLDFSYDAIRDRDGAITGVFVQGMDRTEAVRTADRQRWLLAEVNHRGKNTLATVQSIASHTLRTAPNLNAARASFEARLVALSRAHNLLSASEWQSTDLAELLSQELSAYGAERVEIDGPSLMLRPKATIALALVVHELLANAAKYGSLSDAAGLVAVSWRLVDEEPSALLFDWRERRGPPAAPPRRKGFGSRMMERIVTGELGGRFDPDYASEGFSYRMMIPAVAWIGDGAHAAAS